MSDPSADPGRKFIPMTAEQAALAVKDLSPLQAAAALDSYDPDVTAATYAEALRRVATGLYVEAGPEGPRGGSPHYYRVRDAAGRTYHESFGGRMAGCHAFIDGVLFGRFGAHSGSKLTVPFQP